GDRECVLGIERPARSGIALPRAGGEGGARRSGGDALRSRLHPRARARHAAGGGRGHRHRSAGDALHRRRQHPRRDPLSAPQAGRGIQVRLRWRVTAAAFVLFLLASAAQYGLATWLGAATVFSRDTDTLISFGVEAVGFLAAGFLLSFLGR